MGFQKWLLEDLPLCVCVRSLQVVNGLPAKGDLVLRAVGSLYLSRDLGVVGFGGLGVGTP